MKKVLVLDDDHVVHHRIRTLVGEENLVFGARNWREAHSPLFQEKCDLLLIDVRLKGLPPGNVVARTMASQVKHPVKILLISAIDEHELRQKAREAGCAGYIHKSWSHNRVASVLEQHLDW